MRFKFYKSKMSSKQYKLYQQLFKKVYIQGILSKSTRVQNPPDQNSPESKSTRAKSTRVKIHPIKINPSQNPPDQN